MSTLENAVEILRLFGPERRELTVADTTRLIAMPRSSASRLLANMKDLGFLESDGARQPRYRIGNLFLELSQIYRQGLSLSELAEEELVSICRETSHTGYISILQGTDVVVVRVRQGTKPLRVVTPLGQRSPAWETAIGRSLLSRFPDDEVRSRFPKTYKPRTSNSPPTMQELLKRLATVRQRGWSEALNEALPEIGSIAVSVESAADRDMVGFCISYASSTSRPERNEIAQMLVQAAERVGTRVGDDYWVARANRRKQPELVATQRLLLKRAGASR